MINTKMSKIIHTKIKGNASNILNYLSTQLSDGYWENKEGYYEEFWNYLEFEFNDDGLIIGLRKKGIWDEFQNIYEGLSSEEILKKIAYTLEDTYTDAPYIFLEGENSFKQKEVEDLIDELRDKKNIKIIGEEKNVYLVYEYGENKDLLLGIFENENEAKKLHKENPTYRYVHKEILNKKIIKEEKIY